jgi:hypothetical protein
LRLALDRTARWMDSAWGDDTPVDRIDRVSKRASSERLSGFVETENPDPEAEGNQPRRDRRFPLVTAADTYDAWE